MAAVAAVATRVELKAVTRVATRAVTRAAIKAVTRAATKVATRAAIKVVTRVAIPAEKTAAQAEKQRPVAATRQYGNNFQTASVNGSRFSNLFLILF